MNLRPGQLDLADLYRFRQQPEPIRLADEARRAVDAAAATVERALGRDEAVYGINTGFGSLARKRIAKDQVEELQQRLVLSHCVAVGPALSDRVTSLIMLLKVASLARGHSGVRLVVVERLAALLKAGALPVIPGQGSVGASGDLAPLAHLAASLIGEGRIKLKGETLPAKEALSRLGLEPLRLAAKEGLALLNGSQVSTALALDGLFSVLEIFAAAICAGALTVDAALGSDTPFDHRIQEVRGQPGQVLVAGILRELLAGSEIRASHLTCDRVQDPYSLRCQPQVMGAALDVMRAAAVMLEREANAVSDNPLVFPEDEEILSGGNFHAEPVGFAADMIALALSEIAALSERRIAMLTDANHSSLPAFLVAEPGLNSGFMIAHVTAAALASETKQLAHPAVIDSLPTSANQEDHVSMACHGARRLCAMADNVAGVVAIELLAAAQGVDLRRPLRSSRRLRELMAEIRELSPFLEADRSLSPDIEALRDWVLRGWCRDFLFPSLESLLGRN